MNFTLAPFVALEGCIHPGAIVRGRLEKIRSAYSFGMAFPSFVAAFLPFYCHSLFFNHYYSLFYFSSVEMKIKMVD